jgi:hypothetical protein
MLRDDELDDLLRDARRTYNTPADPPLDAMWAEVERAAFAPAKTRWGGARRSLSFRAASLAAAATLTLGVGLGWYAARRIAPSAANGSAIAVAGSAVMPPSSATTTIADTPVAATTSQYLGQTAALLVALRRDAESGRTDRRFATQASELLSTTRLLLDSPAALDPEMRNLLQDLELVLAQVARIPARPRSPASRAELELITRALDQHDVVPRLRSAAAGLATTSGSSDD